MSPEDLQRKISLAQSLGSDSGTPTQLTLTSIRELVELQVTRYPDKEFLIYIEDDGKRTLLSYREFSEVVHRTAHLLIAHGISRGDRIATVSFNHWETVVQYFAAFLIGAVVVPLNPGEDDKRLQYILENSQSKLAFVRQPYLGRIIGIQSRLKQPFEIIQTGSKVHETMAYYGDAISTFPVVAPLTSIPTLADEALIVYTSGTTGNPKGVVLNQRNLLMDGKAIGEWHGMTPDQRMMCVLPIHHVNGIIVTLLTPLYYGGSVILNQKFQTGTFFPIIAAERVSVVSVVPTLLQFLLHGDVDTARLDLGSLRHIICGAGPLTVELAMKIEDFFRIPIVHGYGLSETTCYSCFLPVDLSPIEHRTWLSAYGFPSIGVPLPVNEMEIHDTDGLAVDEEGRGEIVVRGNNVMAGYFHNPEANEHAFQHGWFRSGDEGFYKTDNRGRRFFFITGRIKELIIRGGVNISPLEIDEVLMQIPGVRSGIAVGFENDWYGEEVGALVVLKPDVRVEADSIITACREHLSFAKSPKAIVFGSEVPVTSTGKYQRNKCKHLFAEWKSVQFNEKRKIA